MRHLRFALLGLLALAAFLGVRSLGVTPTSAQAPQGTVSVDVDPTIGTNNQNNCSIDATASLGSLTAPAIVTIEFCVGDIPSSLAMGAFSLHFLYDPSVLRLLSNTVSDPVSTSYFLEKCSGGGEPLGVFALNGPGNAVIGGTALGPVSTACSTSIFAPGGRLASVEFLCVGSGSSVIDLQPSASSFYTDTNYDSRDFVSLTDGTITSVTCPEPPQAFSVAPLGNSACDPADILVATQGVIGAATCSPLGGGPDILIPGGSAGLGLVTGCEASTGAGSIPGDGPPACDDVDALSFGNDDSTASAQRIFFSVGPGATGCVATGVATHAGLGHPETDEYDNSPTVGAGSCTGTNTVFAAAAALLLSEGDSTGLCASFGVCPPFGQNDGLDSLAPAADFPPFYSLAPGSPTLATLGAGPADILTTAFPAAIGGTPAVAISASALGLSASDDIDALCMFESTHALFSLAAGSPALSTIGASEADLLAPPAAYGGNPQIFKDGGDYGILTTTEGDGSSDDLDAVRCEETALPPEIPLGSVLVYTGNGATSLTFARFGNAAGKLVVRRAELPSDLLPFDCVVLPRNSVAFDANQKATLSSYLDGGGRIVASADSSGAPKAIATMNDLAAALGSGLSVVSANIGGGFRTTSNIDPSVFTVGVSSIRYVTTSRVAVSGTSESLVRTIGGTVFIGADPIGSGVFFLSGDSNVFSDLSDTGYSLQDNGVLVANMCGGEFVDIKPGSDPNSINSQSQGLIPVAILSTGFDATTVDGTTVQFGPAGASPVHDQTDPVVVADHQRDVDGDGDLDYVLHFRTRDADIPGDAIEACLTGETTDGVAIEGCDSVRIVPPWLDSDSDGWGDAVEATLATDQFAACSSDASHDAWPPDKDGNTTVGIDDVFFAAARFGAGVGDPNYAPRAEIASQDGTIAIDDVFAFASRFGQTC